MNPHYSDLAGLINNAVGYIAYLEARKPWDFRAMETIVRIRSDIAKWTAELAANQSDTWNTDREQVWAKSTGQDIPQTSNTASTVTGANVLDVVTNDQPLSETGKRLAIHHPPKYTAVVDGHILLFSEKVLVDGVRELVFWYFYSLKSTAFEPCLYYVSQSEGGWRLSPGIEHGGRFNKMEEFNVPYSNGTKVVEELSDILTSIPEKGELSGDDLQNTWHTNVGPYMQGWLREAGVEMGALPIFSSRKANLSRWLEAYLYQHAHDHHMTPEHIKTLWQYMNIGIDLDSTRWEVSDWTNETHPQLWAIETCTVTTCSHDNSYKDITIARQVWSNEGWLWVSTIEESNRRANRMTAIMGVVSSGALVSKPVDYMDHIPPKIREDMIKRWLTYAHDTYGDLRPYIQENPILVAFREYMKKTK